MTYKPKEMAALTQRRHPDYREKLEHWEFLEETYKSERSWFKKNIFRFTREGDTTYAKRVERAYRFNHTREVVDLVNKYLFKVAPVRKPDVPDQVLRFRERATLTGLTLSQFEREVARKTSIYGRVWVVVDNNKRSNSEIASIADEKNGAVRLYSYIVTPKHVLDMGYDDFGQLEWILIEEVYRDDDNPFSGSGRVLSRFRLWTKTQWFVFKQTVRDKIEFVDKGDHNLGVVPVIKADHVESDARYHNPGLIEDIAYMDRGTANYLSCLDQIINDQTFSQLVMPAQGVLPGVGLSPEDSAKEEDEAKRNLMKMGTSQVLLFDGEHGAAPTYISPDPRQASLIITAIRQIINEIYHTVGLAGERTKQDNSVGIDNSSGVAKAYDFERVNALLSAKANAMEQFSNRMETLVRIWNGEKTSLLDPETNTVKYSTSFDVRGLSDDMAIAQGMSLLAAPIEVRRALMTGIVEKIWPMLAEEKKQELQKAIDSWDDSAYTSLNGVGMNIHTPAQDGSKDSNQGAVSSKDNSGGKPTPGNN
ncbi:hypothetical protein [Dyella telluris]|uniref:Phage portal protein n=1 Tax=Dyella telluris TaxID=2763498 RepID=A0A7G8Q4G6_9GAMM|nr:hypothetical protein [Dyella telluris]QNK01674.1 hypothetical protein H8F01_00390 [Dyella telluris]